jgi:hypothetical protein
MTKVGTGVDTLEQVDSFDPTSVRSHLMKMWNDRATLPHPGWV